MKTVKRRSITAIPLCGIFFAGAVYGLVWDMGSTARLKSEGQDDMLGVSIGIGAVFGLVALVFLVLLCLLIKRISAGRGHYIALSAKKSRLPESEIEAFERQAVAPDCYILKLTAGLDRALSNATNKDGLLTRDYIYLADTDQIVMRVGDLRACCFSEYTYFVNSQTVRNLAISLIASNGVSVLSDTTKEAGVALMTLLKERNSAIDVNGGKVLAEGAFESYKSRILGGR